MIRNRHVVEQGTDSAQQHITEALREITDHRSVIDQAKGMLMVIYDLTAPEAFELLKWRSQNDNVKLRVVAEQLCTQLPALARNRVENLRSACDDALMMRRTTTGDGSSSVPTNVC